MLNITIAGYPIVRLTAKQSLEIDGFHVNQGEIFFLAASKSNPDTSHVVRWLYEQCKWQCSCPATIDNCRHVKMVSAWSKDHPYSATHPNGCPVVVKTPPCKAANHKITEVEHHSSYIIDSKYSVWYCLPQDNWYCSCATGQCEHIEIIKNKMHKEAQVPLANPTVIETVLVDNDPPCKVEEPTIRVKAPKRKRPSTAKKQEDAMLNATLTRNEPFRLLKY